MKRLMLIRHPEVLEAEKLKFFGATDVPLSQHGYRQAECLASYLSKRQVSAVYCSPLHRAKYTAQRIAETCKLTPTIIQALKEINFGHWEGSSYYDIIGDDEQLYRNWLKMEPEFRFPGGESLAEFHQRVMPEYKRIVASDLETQDGALIVVVVHGGVIKLILAELLGIHWGGVNSIKQDFGALNILEYHNGYGVVRLMNDTCYLDGLCRD
jgi:broad specificity phosphatase PhoE